MRRCTFFKGIIAYPVPSFPACFPPHVCIAAMYAKQVWSESPQACLEAHSYTMGHSAITWGVFGSLVNESKGKRQGCAATPHCLSAQSAMLSSDRLGMKWLHARQAARSPVLPPRTMQRGGVEWRRHRFYTKHPHFQCCMNLPAWSSCSTD